MGVIWGYIGVSGVRIYTLSACVCRQGLGFRAWGLGKSGWMTEFVVGVSCRPVVNNPPPLKGLHIRIPIKTPIRGGALLITVLG